MITSAYCIDRMFKTRHRRGNPCRAWQSPSVRKEFGIQGDPCHQSFQGRVPDRNDQQKETEETERHLEIYRGSLSNLQVSVDQAYVCEGAAQG